MSTSISKDEQLSMIANHKRNLEFNSYNFSLSLIEENAKTTPDSVAINSLNEQIATIAAQISALDTEAARVEALPA